MFVSERNSIGTGTAKPLYNKNAVLFVLFGDVPRLFCYQKTSSLHLNSSQPHPRPTPSFHPCFLPV